MHDSTVSVRALGDYDISKIKEAILDMADSVGIGWQWIRPNGRVLIKPNLLKASRPEEAVTTHPALVEAVSQIVSERGATPIVADSPAGPYTEMILRRIYQRCGISEVAKAADVVLNMDTSSACLPAPQGRLIRQFKVIKPLMEVDGVINLPKAKTHCFTLITGAVKNLFGLVPGLTKAGFHANLRDPLSFSEMLLDLAQAVRPTITIEDAIVGMDGDGPSAGSIRPMGFILCGKSPVSVDMAFCRLIGIDPFEVPLLWAARERGWVSESSPIWDLGPTDMDDLVVPDFQLPRTRKPFGGLQANWFSGFILRVLKGAFSLKPYILPQACKACGACVESCPAEAVKISSQKASIDHGRCIRCYCCHEVCPERAVKLKGSLAYSILRPLSGRR